jgi:phosphatidylglycerophosphate synthase
MLALLPGWTWLVIATLVFELSFVLDCADGQLARLRKIASPIGHQLDFLMDELKAMLLLACATARLWQDAGDDRLLLVGLGALFCLASGLSLTSFTRRPEYGAKPPTDEGQPAEVGGRKGVAGLVLTPIEFAARIVVHYPQYIWICALANRLDLFFWAYAGVNTLYFLKTLAAILLKLGRFGPRETTT